MPSEFMWVFIYPLSLLLVIGFRFVCAHQQPNVQASRKLAQASYWGEYADQQNENDKSEIVIASIRPEPEPFSPQAPRDVSRPYCH